MVAQVAVIQMVEAEAVKAGIDPYIILGIIKIESNFNSKAFKFEKNYLNFFKVKEFAKLQSISEDSEKWSQKISVGLMQVMFSTSRWLGYGGFFCDFFDPQINVYWGIKYFQRIARQYIYLSDQLSAYNMGTVRKNADGTYVNQSYVDSVLLAIDEIRKNAQVYSLVN